MYVCMYVCMHVHVYTHDSTKAHETLFIYGPSIAPSPKKQKPFVNSLPAHLAADV